MFKSSRRPVGTPSRIVTHGMSLLTLAWLAHVGGTAAPPAWADESPTQQRAEQREIRRPRPIFQEEMLELSPVAFLDDSIPVVTDWEPELSPQAWDAQHAWDAQWSEEEPVLLGCGRCPGVCRCPGHPAKPLRQMPGDVNRGDCPPKRYRIDQRLRSGDPDCVYKWAQPTYSQKYSAWYVGGGGGFIKGRGRTDQEGTWGLDYGGLFGHAKVWLNYTCNRYQGGEGAYQTEHQSLRSKFGHHE